MDAVLIRWMPKVLLAGAAASLLLHSASTVGLSGIALVALALLLAAAGGSAILYLQLQCRQLRWPGWLIARPAARSARGRVGGAGGAPGAARELVVVLIAATVRPQSQLDPVAQRQELLQALLASQRRHGPSGLLVVSASLQQTDDGGGAAPPLSETPERRSRA